MLQNGLDKKDANFVTIILSNCPIHREHTILLSRKRANIGKKRMNSFVFSC